MIELLIQSNEYDLDLSFVRDILIPQIFRITHNTLNKGQYHSYILSLFLSLSIYH
jgi:hypothetical protein